LAEFSISLTIVSDDFSGLYTLHLPSLSMAGKTNLAFLNLPILQGKYLY
jgi:hypothetical protein